MRRIATFIATHPRRVLAATAVVSLVAALLLVRLQFNADVGSFITEGNERGEAFAALQDKYETQDPVNLVLSLPPDESFTERERLVDLATYRDAVEAHPGVASVTALVPAESPIDGTQLTPELISVAPPQALSAAIDGPLAELLLSEDGRHTLVLAVPDGDGIELAGAIEAVEVPDGIDVTVSGNPAIYAAVIDVLSFFLLLIPPVVLFLLVGTFYANVGERKLSLLAVVPALLGSLWTFGLLAGLGREIDIVTVIVPIFVLVMGSADGLHFVTHFQDIAKTTPDPVDRIVSTLREVGIPMILTTISTAVGFLSLLFTDIRPIRQLGTFAAIGIGFAGIISFFTLPALLVRVGVAEGRSRHLLGHRVTGGLKWLAARRWSAAVLVGVVGVFAAVFIPQLDVDSDPLFMFGDDHEVRVAFEQSAELFGGATPLTGEFAFDPDDPLGSLDRAAAATAELEQLDSVRAVFSLVDLAEMLPSDAVAGLTAGDTVTPLGDLVSDDGLRFMLLPGDFESGDVQEWLDFADASEDVVIISGQPILWDEMSRLVLRAQVGSVVAALVLLSIMLLATYRRLRPTLAAVVPLVLTIAALLGFLAAADIHLNLITAVASSIVIGVGIDYSIHFVAAIDHAREDGPGYVLRAIDRAGRPIVANALGIAIALTALLLSPLRPHHQLTGVMWVSMTVASLGALVVIPALLPREGVESEAVGNRQ